MTKESRDTSKKEVSTTSTPQFQFPILKLSNYSLWAIRMQIILEANGLWEMIEPNDKTQGDNKKDKTAIAFLYQALPEEQLLQITKHKTAKAIWDALKTRHIGEERVQQARLQTLKSEFEMLYMKEDETIDTFTAKLTTIVNKAASLGHTMEDETLVRKLLNVVPDRYLQIVASIEQYSDLDEMTLEEAIGRLKTYEERIKYKKGKQVDNQEKLMFTRHENKRKSRYMKKDVGYKDDKYEYSYGMLDNGASRLHDWSEENTVKELDEKDMEKYSVSKDLKFKEDEDESTNEQHDQETQPIEDDNEFPNNDDDYASPSRDSPLHSQTPHTLSTRSSEINSQVTPNFSKQSYYQSDNDSIQITNSPSHFDHTPLRGFRTLNDLYENTEELLLAEDKPKNYKEASSDQKWIEAMKVKLDSINRNNTWELTTLPKGHKAIGLKWVFKTKKDANGNIIKHKARLVAKGYIQQHGIDFEEVFAPVARMEIIWLLIAIATNNKWEVHHLDVKSAFLHGDLKEEVYVTQPEGFVKRQDNGKVYRLIKALYGLRQAPRAWNIKLDNTLKSLDFKKCALEEAIYTKTSKDSTLLIGVYVDELIIIGTPKMEIDKFKAQMEEKFKMSDLGLLAYYLGIEVT
ncbi:ribonuclease H-like domain, reverse transcriptase, RNA-dependent DNA polymerase [Tanacetum coccineum]